MAGKKITLLFTLTDGSTQEASFTVPLAGASEVETVVVGAGLSGAGTEGLPLKLNLKSSDSSVAIAEDGEAVDLKAKMELVIGTTALIGEGTHDAPLNIYLREKDDNQISAEGGFYVGPPTVTSDDGTLEIETDDDGIIHIQLAEDAIYYGAGLTGDGKEETPVKLALASADGSVTITAQRDGSIDLAAKSSGGGSSAELKFGLGLTGTGTDVDPVQLNVTSTDGSLTITQGDDNTLNLAMNDSLQSLMPKLIADQKPQPLTPGTFKGLADAYKNDRSKVTKPFQKSFKSILEDMGISSHITMMPAVDGKQLYVDGPVQYEPDILMRVACYYIPYDSSVPVCTLFERDTIFAQATDTTTAAKQTVEVVTKPRNLLS